MNNDRLFFGLTVFVLIVFTVVIFLWVRTSGKGYTPANAPVQTTNTPGISNITNPQETTNLQGIYALASLNQRCDPNATSEVSNLLPGFFIIPPCEEGLECIVPPNGVTTGICRASIGTRCGTVFDCAPLLVYTGPTGTTGTCSNSSAFTGPTGACINQDVYCNNICTTKPYGNLLAACKDLEPFTCDEKQGLVCNNVTAIGDTSISNQNCYQVLNEPCSTNADCYGGICFKDESVLGSQSLCRCHGNNPVDTRICMYVDGKPCTYNQECYGGTCFKQGDSTTGICISKFLPGEVCEVIGGVDNCLSGFGCDVSSTIQTCQPIKKPDVASSNVTIPVKYSEAGALCTSYNYNGTADPYLPCDIGLVCNYDLTTSGPPGYAKVNYLQGLGICTPPTVKLGQPCGPGLACLEPGVCIQNNDGQGICSRAQYLAIDEPVILYVNNSTIYNQIGSGQSLINYFNTQGIDITKFTTMSVQLVGGGGGGAYGFQGTPLAGNYGGGGGGSGKVIGYIGNDPTVVSPAPYFAYSDPNPDGLTPTAYQIDLSRLDWDNMTLEIGNGGTAGSYSPLGVATPGVKTVLKITKAGTPLVNLEALGGNQGLFPIGNVGGVGGPGFNGGGAGAGGNSFTAESIGGAGDIIFGGQNGGATYLYSGGEDGGKGGGLGGGLGGNSNNDTTNYSEGGGGAGGSCVNYYEYDSGKSMYIMKPTGGKGAIANGSITGIVNATSGKDFTGSGGGGGALYNIPGTTLYQQALAGNGGKGYAILKFYNINKDLNYVGNTENIGTLPANGSTGKCAKGFTSNGKNAVSVSAKEFCIPQANYTCNTSSINGPGFGTYCMRNTTNGTIAVTNSCKAFSLGIFIQVPYVSTETQVSPDYVNDYLGSWHFTNLPTGFIPTVTTRLSVFQSVDPVNIFFTRTEVILSQQNGTGNTFWYSSFSTKDISPNNPANTVTITIPWNLITLSCSTSSNTLNYIQDIKFLSSGKIGVIVNETAPINFPFTAGNLPVQNTQNLAYNRAYICDGIVNTLTNTISYTGSTNGPFFTPNDPTSIPDSIIFNNMVLNKTSNFVWDIDNTFNNGIAMAFVNGTVNNIYTQNISSGINGITNLLVSGIPVPGGLNNSSVKNLFYTVNGNVGSNINNLFWDQKIGSKNRVYGYFPSYFILPLTIGPDTLSVDLEETGDELSIGMNFNRLQDMEFFDFYYLSQDNQFKYVTTIYNPTTKNLSTVESQIAGYIPDIVYNNTSNQSTYKITAIGNMDRSMYSIVQTCNT